MKPSQFLYSESIKEQKAQKANVTKSIGELKPLPKTANAPKDQNSSMIYSLVSLPVKEGQNDTVVFPQSLISQSMNIKPQVVVGKNTEIARSLKKLKPLDSLEATPESVPPGTGKGVSGEQQQQLQGPKLQVYLKSLNQLTNGQFKKTQTQLLFGSIEPKLNNNTVLCVLRIQKLKFFNEYNQKNEKIPSLFCWEAIYRKKSLMKTTPKEFDAAQQDLLDFVYTRNAYEPVDIILWKIKNNDEKYVGQFDISNNDYQNAREVLDFKSKIICETQIEKEMFKTMKQTKSYIGNVQFQLIQLGHEKIPLNKHSGIPGSPRTEEEKARHRTIDAAMSGQEYRWYVDENGKLLIEKIDKVSQEIVAECSIEVVADECGQLHLVYEEKYTDPDKYGRSRPTSRNMRKQHADATMAMIKELDKNGAFTEVQTNIRNLSRQGRVTRKVIEEALYTMGCTANQLLLTECSEFGDCLMDFLLVTDDLAGVLEAMQELKIVGEEDQNLESFSNNLFQNIGQHLRKNTNLKSVIQFILALEKKPEVALLIQNYSYAPENVLSNTPPFLQNFDPKNYEHVMVLSKLNKMIQNFKINTKFTRALKKAHVEAKKSIYFEIPCFPKNKDLDDKSDSLQLKQMGQNIMHEVVRRQKWNKSHIIFENYSEWFFVADEQGITPFSRMMEVAPFDVIKSLFAAYPDQLKSIFSKFDPNQELFEGRVPKVEKKKNEQNNDNQGGDGGDNGDEDGDGGEGGAKKKEEKKEEPSEDDLYKKGKERQAARRAFEHVTMQKEYKKNLIHCLLLNPDFNQSDLLDLLRNIELLVNESNESNFETLKTQKLRAGDFTPLGLYLELLRSKCKKKLDRVQREIGTSLFICQMLTPNIDEEENNNQQQQEGQEGQEQQQEQKAKSSFVWDRQNQFVISQIIGKLPESLFQQFDDLFRFIKWIPPFEELKTIRYINLPYRQLIKHKQQQKLFAILQQMYDEIKQNSNYDPADVESEQNQKILYTIQIWTLMLLEIRNLRSQRLEQVASQLLSQLREFTQSYIELLVVPMPTNITSSYYPLQHQYDSNPNTILEFFNAIKFNILLTDLPVQSLDKLDIKQLAKALSRCKDKEPLRDLIRLVLTKDQGNQNAGAEEQDSEYDRKQFELAVDSNVIFSDEDGSYKHLLDKKQVEQLLLTYKAEKILPLANGKSDNFTNHVHGIILNSFQTRKSVGVTQQQVALWIRNNESKIDSRWKQRYIDFFRLNMSMQQIHTLIDIEIPKPARTYHNQNKIYPYVQAQGKNWASILDVRRFISAIKDNIQYINIENTLRSVALNGQYEKLEQVLPYVKDAQIIRQTIHLVATIANLQIFSPTSYLSFRQYKKPQPKDDEEEENVEGDNNKPDDGDGGGPQLVSAQNQPESQKQQQSRSGQQQKKKEAEPESASKYLDIASEFQVRLYDPTVYFFKTAIKEKKEKFKVDIPKFPEALDQIRTPLSVQSQLSEMTQSIQLEFDDFFKTHFTKNERLNLKKFESNFEKDVLMFRYLKNWKSSLQRQNFRSIFTSYDQGTGQQSYKKVLNQLLKQYQRYGMPICDTFYEFEKTLDVLMIYSIQNMDQLLFQVASSKMTPIEKNKILLGLVSRVIDPGNSVLAKHYQIKNANTYLQQINRIIKSVNIKLLSGEEDVEAFQANILSKIHRIVRYLKPDMPNDQKVIIFKLASEVLQRFDQLDIKSLFEEQLIQISELIKTRQLRDKALQVLAAKYVKSKDETKKLNQRPYYKDIIASFKKRRLDEVLSTIDLPQYIKNYSDAQCEEIVTELFKLPYEKSYLKELLEKFDRRLFESLMFHRRFRTYTKLINDILFKQILKGKELAFVPFITQGQNKTSKQVKKQEGDNEKADGRAEIVQAQPVNEGGDEAEQQPDGKDEDDMKQDSLSQIAAYFCFYEYFDTLHRFRVKVHDVEPYTSFRFMLHTNEQLLQLATQFEQQGYNYISNCIRMYRYLRLNHYRSDKPQIKLENELMVSFISSNSKYINSPCLNIIKEYLQLSEHQAPFWQNTISDRKQPQKALTRLKINGIERGVKFCFPSNYVQDGDNEITNDDIRRTPVKRPAFTIDQYVEYLPPKNPQRLDNQIINDPEFTSLLNKLLIPSKQLEFLIDKVEFQDNLRKLVYNDHEMYFYVLNFPMFWYEEKLNKDNQIFIGFQMEFELGIIFIKSVLLFEPKLINQALDMYFKTIDKYLKSGLEGEGEQEEDQKVEDNKTEYDEVEQLVTDNEEEKEADNKEENQAPQVQEEQQEQDQQLVQEKQQAPQLLSVQKADQKLASVENQEEEQQNLDEAPKMEQVVQERVVNQRVDDRRGPVQKAPEKEPEKEPVKMAPDAKPPNKEKKYKLIKVNVKRDKGLKDQKFVESDKSLRKIIRNGCSSQQQFQIFLQLILFATTSDDIFRLIQNYLIKFQVISSPQIPKEIDPVIKARLLKDGFKEPFNLQFVEQAELRFKELKQQQIEDIKHVKDVLTQNEQKRHSDSSEVYQALIGSLLQVPFEDYQMYIDKLMDNPAYKCLSKFKKSVAPYTLEKDQKLQMELVKYFSKLTTKTISGDFLQKFFENNRANQNQQQFTNDKWINLMCILNYCKQILKQTRKFQQFVYVERKKLQQNITPLSYYEEDSFVNPDFLVKPKFHYKFKVTNKLEPIIYEYKREIVNVELKQEKQKEKQNENQQDNQQDDQQDNQQENQQDNQQDNQEIQQSVEVSRQPAINDQFAENQNSNSRNPDGGNQNSQNSDNQNPQNPDQNSNQNQTVKKNQETFYFEVTLNIQKGTAPNNPYPVTQLYQKNVEEVVKCIDTLYYENYLEHINNLCSYPQFKVAQLSGSDNIDYIQLKTKLTKENFREYQELHYAQNFYLDQTIMNLEIYKNLFQNKETGNNLLILKALRDGIVQTESNDFENPVKICDQDWILYSSRIRPDIKLKYQDKLYPVPYSNYQPRQRNTQYKQSIQVDQSFPELYPIVNLQVYQYIPDVMTEEQFNQKYDQLSIIQQACYDLNSYAQSLDDFITQSPSEEELQNLRDVAPQIVSWPLIRSKLKRDKGSTEEYKIIHSAEAHPLFMIEYLFSKVQIQLSHQLKFTFNVLSFTEIILFKLTRILQQTTGKRCKLSTTTSMLSEWALLKKILLKIGDLIVENELDKFRFYYVEINEVHQNSVFPIKSNKLEGMDAIFRFGQTQFYVHSNVLIVRLNVAVVSENASTLIAQKNVKVKSNELCPLLFKEDKELRGYMNYIITLEDMLKQIFTKK
ncbi:unnamed protein product (macronuclear) [Paramecium tetraurelia]|uniref:Uncharacterized protein n=1 Tax=Paramecium tetraurelia TaxID=5888 RepID=A0DIY6_PARTE|nr:uncharacterized protein GSPATT00017360001 [Paramecium tetraurelia]CAK83003.1 unnamed protein product [Paramecium tetraurelia]|eukprot:XP_001450400.1 hypothetical protein (macronuclear) [Paramecium tetraurelia strain d4-2]